MNTYPILNLLVLHGSKIAAALGVVVLALCASVGYAQSAWIWYLVGPIGGLLAYVFVASYAELVRLVTDMLMPK